MKKLRTLIKLFLQKKGYDIISLDLKETTKYKDLTYFVTRNRPLILDVGANNGGSVDLFKRIFPNSRIHCFEPGNDTFTLLTEHCKNIPDVTLWNTGVGSTDGRLPFLEYNGDQMSSFLEPGADLNASVIKTSEADIISLDNFAAKEGTGIIDLLKSDTQGFEMEVLKGSESLIRNKQIRSIYLEINFSAMYKNQAPFYELFQFLIDRNFLLVGFYDQWQHKRLMGWADAFFVHKDHYEKVMATQKQ